MSKKGPASALHHSVKTVDRSSKTSTVPGLHHTATSPVVQDQVVIDDSATGTTGTKTLKTITSGKTRFVQSDSQVRDPISRPVVQTIKTVQEPSTDSSQGVKSLKTADTGKTRFSEEDKQLRDPITVIKTVKSTRDPITESTKTLKTATRGKTRFSQGDTQIRDPVASPVIQTVKTVQDPSTIQQTVKTSTKTEPSVVRRKTVKSSQKSVQSASASGVPESIVETARRNTLRISVPDSEITGIQASPLESTNVQGVQLISNLGPQFQSGFGGINERGEITLDGEIIRSLQNAGGLVGESGEITLNEEAMRFLQNTRVGSLDNISPGTPGTGILSGIQYASVGEERRENVVVTRPQLRVTEFKQTSSVSNQNQRQRTRSRITGAQVNTNYGPNQRSQVTLNRQRGAPGVTQPVTGMNTERIVFNGKEINVSGLKPGQLFDENLQPILAGNVEAPRPADIRVPSVPQNFQPVRSSGVAQTAAVSSLTSNVGSRTRTTGGATRRRQQVVTIPEEKVVLRTPARAPVSSNILGTTGVRQSTTLANKETVFFNGQEISVGGLQAGQLFDENLKPILADKADISRPTNVRSSPIPQVPQPVRSSGITQTAAVSSLTSNFGSRTRTTGSGTRRQQQPVTVPKEKVKLRTPARAPIATPVFTGTSTRRLGTQGVTGVSQSTAGLNKETIFFNGQEINVGGLQAGQIFDENLQPILTNRAEFSPQIPQLIRSPGITSPAAISSLTSNFGSRTSAVDESTRRRQTTVTIPKERVELRSPVRPTTTFAAQPLSPSIENQGTAGIRQNQETIFFNGKEISVSGLRAGQIFDENLQPISAEKPVISPIEAIKASPIPQIPQPVRSGVTQTAAISSVTSNIGSRTRVTGGTTRRRQQAVTIPRQNVELRTPERAPITSTVLTSSSAGRLGPQGATGVRQSTTAANKETVLFNGQEISIGGLQAGQIFDENLQPILADKGGTSRQTGFRASPVPQIPQPVRTSGVTGTAAVSSLTSTFGSRTTGGATRRQQQTVTAPKERVLLRSPVRQTITPNAQAVTSTSRRQGALGIGKSTTAGNKETILFNGKEISVGGLRAGQIFDENLQPILTDKAEVFRQTDVRASPIPQTFQPYPGITQTAAVSTLSSTLGSQIRGTSGATRRRQQTVTVPKERVQLRAPVRPAITPAVQSIPSTSGIQNAAGIRQLTTTANKETILFNGKEISVDGLRAGQIFDENLQPILTNEAEIARQPVLRTSPIAQTPQRVITQGVTQTAAVSTFGSNVGSRTSTASGATRRRQQSVTIPKDRVQLRAPIRQPVKPVISTTTATGGSQGTVGFRPSTTSANKETVFFNGKEISVEGLRAGQIFDENLQSILTDKVEIPRPADFRSSPIPQIPQPVRSSGNAQTVSSDFGSRTRATGGITGQRQQSVTTQRQNVGLRTAARAPITTNVLTTTFTGPLASQGAAGIRQSNALGNKETIFFNGKEISVSGLQAGQIFDENLQPILTEKAKLSSPGEIRASPIPRIPEPVRSSGIAQTAAISSSNVGSRSRTSNVSTRRRQQAITIPRENVELRTPARASIASPILTSTSAGRLGSRGTTGVRQSLTSTAGNEETIFFNGKEISVSGLQAGQIFDENLQPILTDKAEISRPANVRLSPIPQIPQLVRSPGVAQTSALSSGSPNDGSRSRTQVSGISRGSLSRGSGLRTSGPQTTSQVYPGLVSPGTQRQPSYAGPAINAETILFDGKEISIDGLGEGQLFDENLRPILSSNNAEVSGRLSPAQGSSRGAGVLQLNTRGFAPAYATGSGLRGSDIQRKISQDSITQEITQDRVETPVIQKLQDIPIQKTFEPTESKQTQLQVEDIEQISLTNPTALKTAQVQETIPFTIPTSPSKPSFTRISQVSQKDIDIPNVQQKVITGDFSGYLPKTSFLPPFNYGVPSVSKYGVKTPIVQEQQKVEQEFV